MCLMIAEAIRELYVHVGKGTSEIDDKFIYDDDQEESPIPISFADKLLPDEELWVVLTAVLDFYKKVQSQYDG